MLLFAARKGYVEARVGQAVVIDLADDEETDALDSPTEVDVQLPLRGRAPFVDDESRLTIRSLRQADSRLPSEPERLDEVVKGVEGRSQKTCVGHEGDRIGAAPRVDRAVAPFLPAIVRW